MKKILALLMVALMLVGAVACGPTADPGSNTTDAGNNTAGEKITIGFSVYTLDDNPFFESMKNGFEEAAAKNPNIEVLPIHNQKADESEMLAGCENFINQGVDALVVSPCKPEAMGNIVDKAKEKNIPVIILDIGDGGSDKDAIVVSDMFGGGQIAGKYAIDLLTEKNVTGKEYAIIKCEESATYAIKRGQGFEDKMNAAGYTKVKELTANSDQTEGNTAMKDILAANPNVVAVFCENDNMALGAAAAVDQAGKKGEILVFGFDGNDDAIAAIKDGSMAGTIGQQAKEIGALGIELALKRIAGEELEFGNAANKEIFAPVFLVDATGERNDSYTAD